MFYLLLLFLLLDIFTDSGNLKKWVLVLIIMIFGVGIFFKTLHWYGGNELLLVAHAAAVLFYIFSLFRARKPQVHDFAKVLFLTALAFASLFKILHWPFAQQLILGAAVTFIIYFSILALKLYKYEKQKKITLPGNENNL